MNLELILYSLKKFLNLWYLLCSLLYFFMLLSENMIFSILFMIFYFLYNWSFYLILNSLFLFILVMISSVFYFMLLLNNNKMMYKLLLLNILICFLFFTCNNYFMFYIMYEFAVFPIFLIISFFGYQIERILASSFFLGYTLFFSVPSMLIFIIFQFYNLYLNMNLMIKINKLFIFFLMFIFLVKLPIFLFHIWLPKAHVESPTLGSILLAAILLKLGGFGLMKLLYFIKELFFLFLLFIISICGGIFSCFLCLMQSDFKALVAYSSVVHMNFLLAGFLLKLMYMKLFMMLIMFFHAFISSMMFLYSGILFQYNNTRKIYFSSMNINPSKIMLFILIMVFLLNFNIPPSLGILPELFYFFCIFKKMNSSFLLLFLMGILGSFFCIYIIFMMSSGKNIFYKNNTNIFNLTFFPIIFIFSMMLYFYMSLLL